MVSLAASVVFWLDRRLSSYAPASFDDCLLEVVGPTGRAFSVRELPDRIAPGQFKEIFDLSSTWHTSSVRKRTRTRIVPTVEGTFRVRRRL